MTSHHQRSDDVSLRAFHLLSAVFEMCAVGVGVEGLTPTPNSAGVGPVERAETTDMILVGSGMSR